MSSPPDARGQELRDAGLIRAPRGPMPQRSEVAWDEAERTLALVSGKWALRIFQALEAHGSLRHNELLRELGTTVSARSLDATMRRMQDAGLVDRRVGTGSPPSVSYEMTSLARSLIGPLAALGRWGSAHQRELRAPRHGQPPNPVT